MAKGNNALTAKYKERTPLQLGSKLHNVELKYPTHEKELLTIKETLQRWRVSPNSHRFLEWRFFHMKGLITHIG